VTSVLQTVKEWINPDWVRHRSVPRMETGLRPNLRLDEAAELVSPGETLPDDIAVTISGRTVISSGTALLQLTNGGVTEFAECGGSVSAITAAGESIIAAVHGRGLVAVGPSGAVTVVSEDASLRSGVTAMCVLRDGTVLAAIGSTTPEVEEDWGRALLAGDASGRLVRVSGATVSVEADGLAWPAGLAPAGDGEVVVSLSLDHRVEARSVADLTLAGRPLATNLPVYPGRIVEHAGGHWLTAPRPRNRVTEMLLDEPRLIDEMTSGLGREQWFIPRLESGDLFTEAMQMGQLRVLGTVKSWAPSRSAGVIFRLDDEGRIAQSAHARVDSPRHGATGIAVSGDHVLVALRGHRSVLRLDADNNPGEV
jgi:hypothetical protein